MRKVSTIGKLRVGWGGSEDRHRYHFSLGGRSIIVSKASDNSESGHPSGEDRDCDAILAEVTVATTV
ncbi:hypothetical protein AKJ16_DCAP15393 [Drosera capensis]